MFDLVERRKIWFLISSIAILPGLIYMAWHLATAGTPLPLNIDYTGGTLWEVRFEQPVAPTDVRQVFVEAGYPDTTSFLVQDDRTVQLKFKSIDTAQKEELIAKLQDKYGPFEERFYRSIGPSIGAEVSRAALAAVIVASLLILLYIAWAFREVSHPFRYGTAAILALIHDVLVTVSFFAIMNLVAGWEVDALFLTAVLTVIGFSVNDTIVIFDRIRENLRRFRSESFATIANRSLIETAQRSIATQVTALLILAAILLFGGATLQQFMATLIVGLISGTYSSLFTATPILVAWEEGSLFHRSSPQSPANGRPALAQ
jgi:preprotein translocase subunit SecF